MMENENKWEYDYSASNTGTGGAADTGYPNVGSSGMNTANQYNEPEAQPERPAYNAPADGGSVPPTPPYHADVEQPEKPRRKRFNGKKLARSAVALVLAAAMGFAGGFVGAKYGGSKVVIQQVERPASSDSSTDSTGNSISATSGTGLTTAQVAEMVSPSVVVITTEQVVYSQWSWYGQSQVESGAGSGVIISSDGYILTCAHVVSGASNITVTIGDKDYPATLVGEDSTSDIAVVKIDATGLTPATVGNSDSLKVGESVMAVGNPLGELGGTVTSGIVSALNRSVSIQSTSSVNTMSLIQMDASVSPGNSGGGLFNMNGELVGIVNAKSSSSDAEGLGFAIPVNDAVKVAQELLENGYVTGRPYLGISYYAVTDAQTAAQLGVNAYGVYIVEVVKGGPADKAGLQAGDRIVSVDGNEVASKNDLGTLMQNYKAGDALEITVARGGQMQTVTVTLGEKGAENS
jgi:serine protease Do